MTFEKDEKILVFSKKKTVRVGFFESVDIENQIIVRLLNGKKAKVYPLDKLNNIDKTILTCNKIIEYIKEMLETGYDYYFHESYGITKLTNGEFFFNEESGDLKSIAAKKIRYQKFKCSRHCACGTREMKKLHTLCKDMSKLRKEILLYSIAETQKTITQLKAIKKQTNSP